MATISSHILNAISGESAVGIRVVFFRLDSQTEKTKLFDIRADEQGRIAATINPEDIIDDKEYELVFYGANYFANSSTATDVKQIVKTVVARFSMPDPEKRYHFPIMLSPHSYSMWWSR